jgi:hypothetical protein
MVFQTSKVTDGSPMSSSANRDLKFDTARAFLQNYKGIADSLNTSGLRPIAETLIKNLDRIVSLVSMPAWITITAMVYQQHLSLIDFDFDSESLASPATDPGISPLLNQIAESYKQNKEPSAAIPKYAKAIALFNLIHTGAYPVISDGFSGLLAAQVIGAWTAFETMATDLWIEVVNRRPAILGERLASAPDSENPRTGKGKSIPFDELQKHQFDLRAHMGDAMAYKFHFSKFEDLKHAYSTIFDGEDSVLKHLADSALWVVNAVRNLLVHRGGIVDQAFLRKVKSNPELSALKAGDEMPLDGKMTAEMTGTCIGASTGLLSEIDQWLVGNPVGSGEERPDDDSGYPLDSCQL